MMPTKPTTKPATKTIPAKSNKGRAGNVVTIKPAASVVRPPEGWEPNCKYGLQRVDDSQSGLLVRLEEVAVWLAQRKPRNRVILELFSPLIVDDGFESRGLYILSARDYAQPLIEGDAPSQKMAGFWQHLPFVDRQTLPEYVARDIADEWCDAWPGLADPRTDSDWWHELVIQNNLERTRRFKAEESPLTEGAGFDTETRRIKMDRLSRLAVRLEQAHALWGYGLLDGAKENSVDKLPADLKSNLKWTDERLAELLSNFDGTPGKTIGARMAVLAVRYDVGAANVKKYLAKAREVKKAALTAPRWQQLIKRTGNR